MKAVPRRWGEKACGRGAGRGGVGGRRKEGRDVGTGVEVEVKVMGAKRG